MPAKKNATVKSPVKKLKKALDKDTNKNKVDLSSNDVFLTEAGLKSLTDELENLKTNRRMEIAEKIKEAIGRGDLSENAEYEEAKNEQAFIEGRIIELEGLIKNAKIFKEKTAKSGSKVQIGNTIDLYNEITKEKETYTIVGSIETDPLKNKISNESPVGASVIGSEVGDTIKIKAPGGPVSYTIKKIY